MNCCCSCLFVEIGVGQRKGKSVERSRSSMHLLFPPVFYLEKGKNWGFKICIFWWIERGLWVDFRFHPQKKGFLSVFLFWHWFFLFSLFLKERSFGYLFHFFKFLLFFLCTVSICMPQISICLVLFEFIWGILAGFLSKISFFSSVCLHFLEFYFIHSFFRWFNLDPYRILFFGCEREKHIWMWFYCLVFS